MMKFIIHAKRMISYLVSASMIASVVFASGVPVSVKPDANVCVHHIHTAKCTELVGGCQNVCSVCKTGVQGIHGALSSASDITIPNKSTGIAYLKKITRINLNFSDTSLLEYKATAPSVAAGLPSFVNVSLEDGATVDLPIVWNCVNYNASPEAKNVFEWSVLADAVTGKYDVSSVSLSGSIVVTNAAAIAVLNSSSDVQVMYDGNGYDLSSLFLMDVNSGTPTYELTGGSGSGSIAGSVLNIVRAGTFNIKLSTAANGAYAPGVTNAVLTVVRAPGEGSVRVENFAYGSKSVTPELISATNGINNVGVFYKAIDADDSQYSQVLPESVGTYSVKAVFAANDLYEEAVSESEFTITKGIPGINTKNPPEGKRVRKRSKLSASSVTRGEMLGADGAVLSGSYAWSEPDKVMLIDGMEKAIFTPDDANYEAVEVEIPVDVYSSYDHNTLSGTVTYYNVYFVTNGGSRISSIRVLANQKIEEPDEPEKEGYIFDGWYTDQKLTKPFNFNTSVGKNLTLYAGWTEITYEDDEDEEKEEVIVKPSSPSVTPVLKPAAPVKDIECGGTVEEGCRLRMFYDLDVGEWYHQSIDYVVRNGLMNGTGEHMFEPDSVLTRAMLVAILYRLEGEPAVSGRSEFADVEIDGYYEDAVIWAKYNNIVNGYTAFEFAPEDYITREQFAAIMYRYAIYKKYDVSAGADANILSYNDMHLISNYAVSAIQYAVGSGLMKGKTSQTLNPQDNATRAEAAAILHRFVNANS